MGRTRGCFVCNKTVPVHNVVLHRFPKNESVLKKWTEFCSLYFSAITNEDDFSSQFLCSDHFSKDDYRGSRKHLSEHAVPKIHSIQDMDIDEQKKIEEYLKKSLEETAKNDPSSNTKAPQNSSKNAAPEKSPIKNQISESAFTEMCRCCVRNKGEISVFEAHFDNQPFADLIQFCTQEKINSDDKLPKTICNLCMQLIISSYAFIRNAKNSQNHIKKLGKSLNLYHDDSNSKTDDLGPIDDVIDLCEPSPSDSEKFKQKFRKIRRVFNDLCEVLEDNKKEIKKRCSVSSKKIEEDNVIKLKSIDTENENDSVSVPNDTSIDFDETTRNTEIIEVHSVPSEEMETNFKELVDADFKNSHITYDDEGNAHIGTKKKTEIEDVVCFECSENFETETKLLKHCKETGHVMPDRYKCEKCPATFLLKRRLNAHSKCHKTDAKRMCEVCGIEVVFYNLKRHLETHSTTINFPCQYCGKGFTQRSSRNTHMKSIHLKENDRVLCFICGKTFTNNFLLNNHLNKEHEDEDLETKSYSCDKCQKFFITENSLRLHRKCQHRPEAVKRTKSSTSQLTKRKRAPMRGTQCPKCDLKFKGTGLKVHILRDHEGIRPYQCHICDRNFLMAAQLKNHILKHMDDRPYECNVCLKTFRWKRYYDAHLKRHNKTMNSTYEVHTCSVCNETFGHIALLRRHEQSHLESMNFTTSLDTMNDSDSNSDYYGNLE